MPLAEFGQLDDRQLQNRAHRITDGTAQERAAGSFAGNQHVHAEGDAIAHQRAEIFRAGQRVHGDEEPPLPAFWTKRRRAKRAGESCRRRELALIHRKADKDSSSFLSARKTVSFSGHASSSGRKASRCFLAAKRRRLQNGFPAGGARPSRPRPQRCPDVHVPAAGAWCDTARVPAGQERRFFERRKSGVLRLGWNREMEWLDSVNGEPDFRCQSSPPAARQLMNRRKQRADVSS